MKTIEDQRIAMRKSKYAFPEIYFGKPGWGPLQVIWVGHLQPWNVSYQVLIWYADPSDAETEGWVPNPSVYILNPRLKVNFDAPEEAPLPHVYFDPKCLTMSRLCLFDPAETKWTDDDLVAEKIVTWTADWLSCYEFWEATGRWHGAGRHAGAAA